MYVVCERVQVAQSGAKYFDQKSCDEPNRISTINYQLGAADCRYNFPKKG